MPCASSPASMNAATRAPWRAIPAGIASTSRSARTMPASFARVSSVRVPSP